MGVLLSPFTMHLLDVDAGMSAVLYNLTVCACAHVLSSF